MRVMRKSSLGLALAVLATFCIAGCSKSSQSPTSSNFTQQSGSSASAPAPGSSGAPSPDQSGSSQSYNQAGPSQSYNQSAAPSYNQPAPQPAPQPVSIRVPVGTDLHVVLDQAISSATAQSGDAFSATLVRPVIVHGQTVIPSNARVAGQVVEALSSGRLSREARLVLTLDSVRIGGRSYTLQTSSIARVGASHKKRDIIAIGGGSALGAIIGGIAGGGKGAAIGAAAGAGAGTAGAAVTGKKDIVLPAEASLSFRLQAPLVIRQ